MAALPHVSYSFSQDDVLRPLRLLCESDIMLFAKDRRLDPADARLAWKVYGEINVWRGLRYGRPMDLLRELLEKAMWIVKAQKVGELR